jgi:ABC-type lipoprotein export system ATPase subunit
MIREAVSESGAKIIQLENAQKIYQMGAGGVKALAGITLSFTRGSFWAIIYS